MLPYPHRQTGAVVLSVLGVVLMLVGGIVLHAVLTSDDAAIPAGLAGAVVVRNRWYYGWGIRYTPHGWLFAVSGLDAVEIGLASGRTYRIGTDEPEALVAAIRAAAGLPPS